MGVVIAYLFVFCLGLLAGEVSMAFMLAARDLRWDRRKGAR